jgi:deoxyribose-phosphate aldolase
MSTAARVISTQLTVCEIAALIDHSLLRPELTDDDVRYACELAERYGAWSVCVKPADVALAARLLTGTGVTIGTVVGFPHGSFTVESKLFETGRALDDGAREIDMVINIGALRGAKHDYVEDEVSRIVQAAHSSNVQIKAAGGVRALDRLLEFVAIGVTRFGATATAAILDEAAERSAEGAALLIPAAPRDEGATDAATY